VHFPGIKQSLLREALTQFYEIRETAGLKKKPSTSEVLDWIRLLVADDVEPEDLRRDAKNALPKLHGALLKNEQDVHLFERLADRQPAYQALILGSLFAGHFLLLWGVASLFGKDVPWPPFVLAVLLTAGAALYANHQGPLFWVRVIAVSGFASVVYLMCCLLVWRARSHRVDLVLASVFLIQACFSLSRVVRVGASEIDLTTHSAFKSSQLASSMQTENAIFAIMIGLALFARYSVTLVQQLRRLAETAW
jgi:hypothetical protein